MINLHYLTISLSFYIPSCLAEEMVYFLMHRPPGSGSDRINRYRCKTQPWPGELSEGGCGGNFL